MREAARGHSTLFTATKLHGAPLQRQDLKSGHSLKSRCTEESRDQEGLTESAIVKHYGYLQIRNSQEEVSCSVTHVCKNTKMLTSTHAQVEIHSFPLPSSPAVSWPGLFFHTLAVMQRMHLVRGQQTSKNAFPIVTHFVVVSCFHFSFSNLRSCLNSTPQFNLLGVSE